MRLHLFRPDDLEAMNFAGGEDEGYLDNPTVAG